MAGRLHYLKTAKEAAGTWTQSRMKISPKNYAALKDIQRKMIVTHSINHNGINIGLKETAGSIKMPEKKQHISEWSVDNWEKLSRKFKISYYQMKIGFSLPLGYNNIVLRKNLKI